jgi:hypothetical protein
MMKAKLGLYIDSTPVAKNNGVLSPKKARLYTGLDTEKENSDRQNEA